MVGNAISRCAESIELVVQFTTMCSGGESPVQSLTPQVLVVVIGKESDPESERELRDDRARVGLGAAPVELVRRVGNHEPFSCTKVGRCREPARPERTGTGCVEPVSKHHFQHV